MIFQPGVGGSGGGLSVIGDEHTTRTSINKTYEQEPKLAIATIRVNGVSGIEELAYTIFSTQEYNASIKIKGSRSTLTVNGLNVGISHEDAEEIWLLVLG